MGFERLKIEAASSMQPIEQSQISKERLLLITKRARVLFLAYPRSDYDEPDGALASYVEVLSGYSDGIVQFVTDNRTGIQRRSKFPPRIAELVEACDQAAANLEKQTRYKLWGQTKQIEGPAVEKPTLEELKAKYGENWGLSAAEPKTKKSDFQAPSWEQIAEMYQAEPGRINHLADALKRLRMDEGVENAEN